MDFDDEERSRQECGIDTLGVRPRPPAQEMGDTDNTASAQVIRLLSKATLKHVKMNREIDYTDTIGLGRFVAQSSKILIFINLLENNTRQDPNSYIIFTTYMTTPTKILTSKLFCTIVLLC